MEQTIKTRSKVKSNDMEATKDYGINNTEMSSEVKKTMSPRYYLHKKDIHIIPTCGCHGADKIGNYEIRINPTIVIDKAQNDWGNEATEQAEGMREIYESLWDNDEYFDWALFDLGLPVYYSEKIDRSINNSECPNMDGLKKVEDGDFDFEDAIENGNVLRLFYPTQKSCFADFKKIFERLYFYYSDHANIDAKYEYKNVNSATVTEIEYRLVPVEENLSDAAE